MVAITGQVPSHLLGRDIFQEVDITGAVAPFSKHSLKPESAVQGRRVGFGQLLAPGGVWGNAP